MPKPFRKTIGAAMILMPLLGLVSAIASPPLESEAAAQLTEIARHSDRWYLYAIFITASCWAAVPAVVGVMSMLADRAPRLALVGGALSLLGVLVAVGDATTELIYWQMAAPGADRGQMVALSDRYDHATGASIVFALGGIASIAGLVLLAAGLWRLRRAPVWAALAVPAGAIVNIAGFSLSSNVIVAASNVVWLAGFGWLGYRFLAEAPTRDGYGLQPHATTT